jgi:hypothetical protein
MNFKILEIKIKNHVDSMEGNKNTFKISTGEHSKYITRDI